MGMGILNAVWNITKARMAGRVLQKTVGGRVGTALMVGYLGKKAYDALRARRVTTPQLQRPI